MDSIPYIPIYKNTTPVSVSDSEYERVANYVRSTYPKACIAMIDRIHIPAAKDRYEKKLKELSTLGYGKEVIVFHGTKQKNIEKILLSNFKPELGVSQAYGNGTYFATNFGYSWTYSDGNDKGQDPMSYMFVCKIAPGREITGIPNRNCPVGYHSQIGFGIYAIPTADQILPEYLIRFHKSSERGTPQEVINIQSNKILMKLEKERKALEKKMKMCK